MTFQFSSESLVNNLLLHSPGFAVSNKLKEGYKKLKAEGWIFSEILYKHTFQSLSKSSNSV